MLSKTYLILVLTMIVALVGVPASSQTWDYSADFSRTVNPSGAWTYGSFYGDHSTFVAATWAFFGTFGPDYAFWVDEPAGNPCAGAILGPGAMDYEAGSDYPAAYLPLGGYMGSPNNANSAVARWTSPIAGQVQVSVTFTGGVWSGTGSNSDVWTFLNGTSLFSGHVQGFNGGGGHAVIGTDHTATYTGLVNVAVGDTIDFAASDPGTRDFGRDQLSFGATITAVPEPSALLALTGGLGCLAAIIRRRRA